MSVIDNKLINYGNLAEFHSKIIDDSSVSTLATWSSQLINNELADKQDVLTAGAGIDISNGVISATGGDAIEDVSVLPDASANKNKLIRLTSDKKVYVSEFTSETITTNRLPDEQQIDKAYLYTNDGYDICYYKGSYKIICSDGELDGYGWLTETNGDGFWFFYLSEDNAVNVTDNSSAIYYSNEDFEGEIDRENHIITTEYSKSDINIPATLSDSNIVPIPAIYNAPESAQIGNATLDDATVNYTWIYDGTSVTITIDGEQFTGYKWLSADAPDNYILTEKQASNIYFYYDKNVGKIYYDVKSYLVSNGVASEKSLVDLKIPQLNAPDSEQVNNATLVFGSEGDDFYSKYTGEEVTLKLGNEEKQGYLWKEKPDSFDGAFVTEKDAEHTYGISDNCIGLYYEGVVSYVDGVITLNSGEFDNINWKTLESQGVKELQDFIPYQRTEVTEEWDWQRVVTEDELYQNESTFTGATLTVDGSQPSIVASGSTTIVWDDLSSTIPSGKSVEVSVVLINTGNSALTPTMSGSYQMMGDGNLTIQVSELGLYRGRYISALNKWLVEAINQEVSGAVL